MGEDTVNYDDSTINDPFMTDKRVLSKEEAADLLPIVALQGLKMVASTDCPQHRLAAGILAVINLKELQDIVRRPTIFKQIKRIVASLLLSLGANLYASS